MKTKEPTRKHPIPKTGENWMKREMRKPFRVMFWILVGCAGVALLGELIVSVGTRDTEHKVPNEPVVSEERRAEKKRETLQQQATRICNDVCEEFIRKGEKDGTKIVIECSRRVADAFRKRGLSEQEVGIESATCIKRYFDTLCSVSQIETRHEKELRETREYEENKPGEITVSLRDEAINIGCSICLELAQKGIIDRQIYRSVCKQRITAILRARGFPKRDIDAAVDVGTGECLKLLDSLEGLSKMR